MSWSKYHYHRRDKVLGRNIHYYDDMLDAAKTEGYDCVVDAIKGLHEKHEGNTRLVGEVFGACRESVLRWFKRLGLPVGARGGHRGDLDPRRQELLAMSAKDIKGRVPSLAREWGISKYTMYSWLRQAAVRKRKEDA